MKNIIVSVDDDLYHRARARAAQKRTTLAMLVREFLERVADEGSDFDRLQRQQNELIARIRAENPGFSAAEVISRDELHERPALG